LNDLLDMVQKVAPEAQCAIRGNRVKIVTPVESVVRVAKVVKEYGFNHIESVCGTDYHATNTMEVLYMVGSVEEHLKSKVVILGSRIPRDNPVFPSLINIWPGAYFHEREEYEMLGIRFEGHPKLAKLLLPDDWDDIHPLRKDFHVKKWGAIEREDSGLRIERAVLHNPPPECIPTKSDFMKVKTPPLLERFQQALDVPEYDTLGRQLFQWVRRDERTIAISFGIQHPGSGHMRLVLGVDGDIITEVEPDIGYVHRGKEKMCEYKNYLQNIPLLERPTVHDSCGMLFPYVLAVEELLDISDKVPERAKYLRIIMAEFNRILNHTYWLAIMGIFTGHSTMFEWAVGDRELIIDAAQRLTGARVTFSYFVPGGVRNDAPDDWVDFVLKICDKFEERIKHYREIYLENPLFLDRTVGVGVLRRQDAIELGIVGPALRASGVYSDTRKDEPYSLYDTIDFDVPVMKEGDSYARCMVSYLEMFESLKIIRQAVKMMKPGPVRYPIRGRLRGREGEVYARTEAARGGLSVYIVSDGKEKPYRVRISTPSFRNLLAGVKKLLPGHRLADVPVIHWSLNYWAVEADR
jgi:NADH-quinone oxidoreductase subunit D